MKIFEILERNISIEKIILLPIFIGLLLFLGFVFLFPNSTEIGETLALIGLLLSGFSGLLMAHYKKVPGREINPKIAFFIGIFTTLGCWGYLLWFILEYWD